MFNFIKYNGLGNDFVIIDNRDGAISLNNEDIVSICHRFFGIGADGLMLAEESSKADIRMVFFNSDGSRAGMCGNGLRCFTRFAYEKLGIQNAEIAVETDSGILTAGIITKGSTVDAVKVNMGRPIFESGRIPCTIAASPVLNQNITVSGKQFTITSMLMGVPHTVIFTDNLEDETVVADGRLIENSEFFPCKTNVNFVKILKDNEIVLRTWERGAGYTYACGTGACASVVAGILNGKLQDSVLAHLRGGDLRISWRDQGDVYMEGPAVEVFEGIYKLK